MRKLLLLYLILFTFQTIAQVDLSFYLPENTSYDPNIPTPKEVIGHEVGEWHVTHDRLVNYAKKISETSSRASLIEMGSTHEGRPQLLLVFTSEENQKNLNQIRLEHQKLTDADQSSAVDISVLPVIIWQGFSIHGNEASGSNASLITAYHYAAAQGEQIENLMENAIILLDPSFNPDGLTRFSTWVNSRRSKNLVSDPNSHELREFGPSGRTNHYWFDLNRDWLLLQHPESQNRIKQFHLWKPNVLTDHHEMGSNNTFFFQPGIPSRNNPNTPGKNYNLTAKIGQFHAKALDNIGSLYYAKESFDDFYYGKGSTYPDINGAIGILFEQASSRGHARKTENGVLTFPFAIRNQFVTSLSTSEAALALKDELLVYQREFYLNAKSESLKSNKKAVIFSSVSDVSRARELAKILEQHQIEVFEIKNDTRVSGINYPKESSYYVSLEQDQSKLIQVMFDKVTSFNDSLFYDISAWTMPLAFNLDYKYLTEKEIATIKKGSRFGSSEDQNIELEKSQYAYAFSWNDYYSPKLLWKLMSLGILVKVAGEEFTFNDQVFAKGSIVIPVQNQQMGSDRLFTLLNIAQKEGSTMIFPIHSGETGNVNLGSPSIDVLRKPSIAVLSETGMSSYEVGEVWHLLDNRFDISATLIPSRIFNRVNIDKYNTLIMVNGNYSDLNSTGIQKLKSWVKEGGNVIAIKGANRWLKKQEIIKTEWVDSYEDESDNKDYGDLSKYRGAQVTGGAIFGARIDISHPLGYGYSRSDISIFVNTNDYFKVPDNPYSFPLKLKENPIESGYVSEENLERISNSAGIVVSKYGTGKVISFSFNPNFRAFWYGTNKLFLNAIFFGHLIDSRSTN